MLNRAEADIELYERGGGLGLSFNRVENERPKLITSGKDLAIYWGNNILVKNNLCVVCTSWRDKCNEMK